MLFLTERDVLEAIDSRHAYQEAVATIEEVLRQQSLGSTFHLKRLTMEHPDHPGHLWHNIRILPGMVPDLGAAAVRVYSGYKGTNRSEVICLFNWEDMEMVAIISDYHLHAIRTAAPYGVAAKYLARKDAKTLGVIGTGRYARGFVQACCAVRDIQKVQAYSRSAENRKKFCEEMGSLLGIEVVATEADSEPAELVRTCNADVVVVGDGPDLSPATGALFETTPRVVVLAISENGREASRFRLVRDRVQFSRSFQVCATPTGSLLFFSNSRAPFLYFRIANDICVWLP